ncbi:MAG: SprB repeat-containing protein, partial [Bacteroidetes bacterium]|nr:SprB repeat-containing protein [Bacteroidota bacterium]
SGNIANIYKITSISKPLFPSGQTVVKGCSKKVPVYGLNTSSITWNSIFPGNSGDYNAYLSCTNCSDPLVTPAMNAPGYVDYLVCGFPASAGCGISGQVCDTVRIYFGPEIVIDVQPSTNAVFCNNSAGVQLSGSASGGSGNYIFTWKDNQGNILANGSSYFAAIVGDYIFEVKDALPGEACIKTENVKVSKINQVIANAGTDILVCAQSPVINLNGSISNNQPASWIGGNGTFNPSNESLNATYNPTTAEVGAGFVQLILKPANSSAGCESIGDTVIITFSKEPELQIISDFIKCNGDKINLNAQASGGIGSYTYLWNTTEETAQINVGAGFYEITVTDSLGCASTGSINLGQPDTLMANAISSPAFCAKDNGAIELSVSGGTAPYDFLWSNGDTNQTAQNLSKGNYTVVVTDKNNCQFQTTAFVDEIDALEFTAEMSHISCNGLSDGNIKIEVSGGNQPYSIEWGNGENGLEVKDLGKGDISLKITDALGCEVSGEFTITQPPLLTVSIDSPDFIKCNGDKIDITAIASGGTGLHQFRWNTTEETAQINVGAGDYSITVTDEFGCESTEFINIEEPDGLIGLAVSSPAFCAKDNGAIELSVSGGTAPLSFLWSNGDTNQTAQNLAKGNYTVVVTDKNNCQFQTTAFVDEIDALEFTAEMSHISCNGLSDGNIKIEVSGGNQPYSIEWGNGENGLEIKDLDKGDISLKITDALGCEVSGEFT